MNSKIVFFINSLDGGGAERVVSTLLNNFASNNKECYLILMENKINYDLDCRINVIFLNENEKQSGLIKFIRLPYIAYKLYKLIKKNNFTKITSFLHRANYVNVISKILFSKHDCIISERISPSSMYSDKTLTSIISKFLIKKLYKKSNKIISVSNSVKYDLKNNFNINTNHNVIYNPYDIEHINKLSREEISLNIVKNKSIISVGSLSKRKNYKLLINSFSKLKYKDFKLYILGKGEEEFALKNQVKQLNLEDKVIFLGFDNNPYKYLSKCEIFVMTSNSEGFPNVLVESMICGCIPVSTDCLSGPREILSPKSNIRIKLRNEIELSDFGILVPTNDEINLRKALEFLIEDKELFCMYSGNSKTRANDFSIDKIVENYKEALEL